MIVRNVIKADEPLVKQIGNGRFLARHKESEVNEDGYISVAEEFPIAAASDVEAARSLLRELIAEYDKSDAVNRINVKAAVGGQTVTIPYWRDRDDRNALKRSAEAVKAAGRTTFVLELGAEHPSLEVDVDRLLADLDQWEVYAQDCYVATANHQRAILQLESAEEVCKYDYKSGYPEMPVFDFTE